MSSNDRPNRVRAAELNDVLEEMFYIAAQDLGDTPRRENNRDDFINIFEEIVEGGQ